MAPVACVVVDGLRGGYPDERESRWYPGDSGYGDRYEDERYRVPEPRHAGPEADPLDPRVPIGPRSGVELPPLPTYEPEAGYPSAEPVEVTGEHHTTPIDRSALRRPAEPPVPTPSPTVYKTRRAGVAGLIAVPAVLAELFVLRVLLAGEFGHTVVPGAVLGGLFAMTGIPLVALGLYALITGPAVTVGPEAVRAWLRTPLAYLPVGLLLLVAAGLAAG